VLAAIVRKTGIWFAMRSGAFVVASRNARVYTQGPGSPINFGVWEGPVFLFDPSNGEADPSSRARWHSERRRPDSP